MLVFQKKEWLCLNCQTQRALSGSLGDIPPPTAQPAGPPWPPATAQQQPPQQKGPNQPSGPRPTVPQQQQKPKGPQVSGPVSHVKQAGSAHQTKGPSQASPQTKVSAQHKGSTQPTSQTKGTTQPLAQSKGPQIKDPNQSHIQNKDQVQSANQTKGLNQAKRPTQTKGSSLPSGAKAPPTSGKVAHNHIKASPAQSKTAPAQSKPTGNNQTCKQPQNQERMKVTSKTLKEDVKTSTKKSLSETITSPEEMKIVDDAQKSRRHEVSYLQLPRLHLLRLIYDYDFVLTFIKIIVTISHTPHYHL